MKPPKEFHLVISNYTIGNGAEDGGICCKTIKAAKKVLDQLYNDPASLGYDLLTPGQFGAWFTDDNGTIIE